VYFSCGRASNIVNPIGPLQVIDNITSSDSQIFAFFVEIAAGVSFDVRWARVARVVERDGRELALVYFSCGRASNIVNQPEPNTTLSDVEAIGPLQVIDNITSSDSQIFAFFVEIDENTVSVHCFTSGTRCSAVEFSGCLS
jgi:hypothetical protein